MPEGLKRARSARRWSQSRLLSAIEDYARHHLIDIASSASLKVYISEWENGRRTIGEPYRSILSALLGATADELASGPTGSLPSVDGYQDLIARIDSCRATSAGMVQTFREQTELFRTFDRQMGASSLVDPVNSHLNTLQDALTFAVLPDARVPIARALAEAATLAAWQALDAGAADRAWRHYETAKSAAREAGDGIHLAHAMGEQAYVLADAGRHDLAVDLVQDARRTGGTQLTPRVRAWFFAAEAELSAAGGHDSAAREALDRAADCLPDADEDRDPSLPNVFLNSSHLARWRGCTLTQLGDEEGVRESYQALETMDATFTRAQAGVRCDLAQGHLARGEIDQAKGHLRAARQVANRTGSVRYLRRIEQISLAA